MGELDANILDFFKSHPYPKDEDLHEYAEGMKMEPDEFETEVYALISSFLDEGRYNENPDIDVDENELKMGIEVEKEHTTNENLARRIALDHLSEPGLSDYYTRLKKMEEEAKKEAGIKEANLREELTIIAEAVLECSFGK